MPRAAAPARELLDRDRSRRAGTTAPTRRARPCCGDAALHGRHVGPVVGPTGTRTILMPKYCAALSNAACAVVGATISGRVMPFVARAQSRYVFIASRMLSVPPEETVPQTPVAPGPRVGSAPPSMFGGHGDDLGLELGGARPQVGVQRVALRVQRVHPVHEVDVLLGPVVHGARDEPLLPALVLVRLELLRSRAAPPRAGGPGPAARS